MELPDSSGIDEPSASRTRPLVRLTFTFPKDSAPGLRVGHVDLRCIGRRTGNEPFLELSLQRLNRRHHLGDARSHHLVGVGGLQVREHSRPARPS